MTRTAESFPAAHGASGEATESASVSPPRAPSAPSGATPSGPSPPDLPARGRKRQVLARLIGRGVPLRRQVLALLILALLPGALYAGLMAHNSYTTDRERAREHLRQQAIAAAAQESAAITGAEQVGKALALLPILTADPEICRESIDRIRRGFPAYQSIFVVDTGGGVICSAIRPGVDMPASVAERPWFKALMSQGRPARASEISPVIRDQPAILVAIPIPGPDGLPRGAVGLVPRLEGGAMPGKRFRADGGEAILVDTEGKPLPGSESLAMLPDAALLSGLQATSDRPAVFDAPGRDGQPRSYALVPLPRGSVNLLFARPEASAFDWAQRDVVTRLVGPLVMLLFTLLVTWVAIDRLVLHWLAELRKTTRSFARGDFGQRPNLAAAPQEIQELGGTLSRMADTIKAREAELEHTLSHREVLLKEIHHRVKNNLQIVSSLLSLQHRALPPGPARSALMQAQTRINALATVHRSLYETEDPSLVDLGRFLRELGQLIYDGMGGLNGIVDLDIRIDGAVLVTSDQAVPLSLVMTEALTNALRHAYPDGRSGVIRVRLGALDAEETLAAADATEATGTLGRPTHCLSVEDDGIGLAAEVSPIDSAQGEGTWTTIGLGRRGIGATLIRSLARQAGGRVTIGLREGGGTRVSLAFAAARPAPPPAAS
ncbi:signal transduction histidine kinase [Rhodospirillum rubrum ATCC 11170]|uniref:histidine kinase n=1 Tax=Rhodospirillum rubrum (strain ATCC 11170 / ATH 1.1.1 / DSM 467 / LMG 4362 / NCIMB 8255 / S1) TaxID=269796 RepID=Q2RP62_RHORT|nr:signal transduction histidine kinase [Rhodospirillum rubrum ATCC 11170]MBK5955768.1 histidine kinase [Rhodospirillum rubrum]HAQ01133.1 histidine kinase [Rhodospirillum rubrum]HCF19012.1 HAMP domain-containing protein [Rhodospirillum rubrum]